MTDSRIVALAGLAYDAIRLAREGLITAEDLAAISAAIQARIADAKEASHVRG